jgi:predicted branched-subunit amino acid permease
MQGGNVKASAVELRNGSFDVLPILVAIAPIGLVFGTHATAKKFSPPEAGLTSAIVYGAAAQFITIELWKDPIP